MADAEVIWAAKTDDELLEAVRELSDFTAEGERVIRDELRRRGLPQPGPPVGQCPRCVRSIYRSSSRDECPQCGEPLPPDLLRALGAEPQEVEEAALVPVLRTEDPGLILLAKSLLEGEGIEYLVRAENLQDPFSGGRLGGYNYAAGPAEFLVGESDAQQARALLDDLRAATPEPDSDPDDA
jgi:hypothetical protein